MSFVYDIPQSGGPLQQGELLDDLWEHLPECPPSRCDGIITFESVYHQRAVVMSPACDLAQDFIARTKDGEVLETGRILPLVLLCDTFEGMPLREKRKLNSTLWKRVEQNQDVRYHHLRSGRIGNTGPVLGDLYFDFSRILTISPLRLYEALDQKTVGRIAVVPAIHIHDLVQRFYAFWSRIGTPD